MSDTDDLLHLAQSGPLRSQDLVQKYGYSRQYAHRLLREMVADGKLVKTGATRAAEYVLPSAAQLRDVQVKRRLKNHNLQEHEVLDMLGAQPQLLSPLPENVRSIFAYAFSEMLNNAIDHSQSATVEVDVTRGGVLTFHVKDSGVGVFRNIMQKRGLASELEAVQDLLKGKTTTAPQAHSGEGIFFTSKIADVFRLESYGYALTVDNLSSDVFFTERKPTVRGTRVTFQLEADSGKHLIDVFRQYQSDPEEHAFDKTEVHVRLYTMGTVHVSRSQARRVLAGLEKFRVIILDFDRVPGIGQAFADEIFRVFRAAHPDITLQPQNMNDAVRFMVERVGK